MNVHFTVAKRFRLPRLNILGILYIRNCRRHELQHSNNKPFVCDVEDCFRSFKSASALQYHKKTHIGERNYVCTYHDCKKAYLSH